MDYEVAIEMRNICMGDKRELTRGQIAGEVIDFDKLMKGLKPETVEKCRAYFDEMIKNDEKKLYDVDLLMEETESVKAEFEKFMKSNKADDIFKRLYDDIEEFFQVPPFEGLDNIEYGIHEVCVYSILEYFTWKSLPKHDHKVCRDEYRDSIAARTFDEVGDKWIAFCDDLQDRYEAVSSGNTADEHALKVDIAACGIIAIAAIRDQDPFALDMAQSGAAEKAEMIVGSLENDTYKEGESAFTDNIVKLLGFVYGQVKENRELA